MHEIFKYLNALDLIALKKSSCHFNWLTEMYLSKKYKTFEISLASIKNESGSTSTPGLIKTIIEPILEHIGVHCHSLSINYHFSNLENKLVSELVAKYCHNLHHMKLETYGTNFWNQHKLSSNAVPNLKELNSLTLSHFNFKNSESCITNYLLKCGNKLDKLIFSETQISGFCLLVAPISLRHLIFVDFVSQSVIENLIKYLKSNVNIHSLHIDPFDEIDLDAVELSVNLKQCRKFSITTYGQFKNCSALSEMHSLEELDLNIGPADAIDMRTYFSLVPEDNCLHSIKIPLNIDNFPLDEIFSGFEKLKKLQNLQLYIYGKYCDKILLKIEQHFKLCTNLRKFSLKCYMKRIDF